MNDINFHNQKIHMDSLQIPSSKTLQMAKPPLLPSRPVNDIVNLSAKIMSPTESLLNIVNDKTSYSQGQIMQVSSSYAKLLGAESSQPLMTKIISLSQNQATLKTDFGIMQVKTPIQLSQQSFSPNAPVIETTSHIDSKNILLNNIINGKVVKVKDQGIIVKTPLGKMELPIKGEVNANVKINIVEKLPNGQYKIQIQTEKPQADPTLNNKLITKAIGTAMGTTKTLNTLQSHPNTLTPSADDNSTPLEKGVFIMNDKQRFSIILKRSNEKMEYKQQSSININGKVLSASPQKVAIRLLNGQILNLNNNNLNLKVNESVTLNIHALDNSNLTTNPNSENTSPFKQLLTTLTNTSITKNSEYTHNPMQDKTYNTLNLLNSIIPRGMPLGAGSLFVAQAMFSMISMNNPTIISNIIKLFMGVNPDLKNLKAKNIIKDSTKLWKDKQQNTWKSYDLPFIMGDDSFKELKVYHRLYNDEDLKNESASKRFLVEMNLSTMGGKIQLDGITTPEKRIFHLILRTNNTIPPNTATTIKKIFITTLTKHTYTGTINFNHTKSFIDYFTQ